MAPTPCVGWPSLETYDTQTSWDKLVWTEQYHFISNEFFVQCVYKPPNIILWINGSQSGYIFLANCIYKQCHGRCAI